MKHKVCTLYNAINMCSIIIYSVSGKLLFSHETNFIVNDSAVQEFHYTNPKVNTVRSQLRLPTPTTIESIRSMTANGGKITCNNYQLNVIKLFYIKLSDLT